jgi:hypothetical protein
MKISFAVACLVSTTSALRFIDLNQLGDAPIGAPVDSLPHCPDFDERQTLNDGRTQGVAYPNVGYNCKSDYQLHQQRDEVDEKVAEGGAEPKKAEKAPPAAPKPTPE